MWVGVNCLASNSNVCIIINVQNLKISIIFFISTDLHFVLLFFSDKVQDTNTVSILIVDKYLLE